MVTYEVTHDCDCRNDIYIHVYIYFFSSIRVTSRIYHNNLKHFENIILFHTYMYISVCRSIATPILGKQK